MNYWQIYTAHAQSAQSQTEAPSLRKFEGNRTPMSSVKGEYLISTNPYFSNAMHALQELDEIE